MCVGVCLGCFGVRQEGGVLRVHGYVLFSLIISVEFMLDHYLCVGVYGVFGVCLGCFGVRPRVEYLTGHGYKMYMSAEENDQTKKVNNRFRPPETNIAFWQGRLGATKKRIWAKTTLPPNGFSILPMGNVQGGMPDTMQVSKIPESAQNGPMYPDVFLYWAVFSTPIDQM